MYNKNKPNAKNITKLKLTALTLVVVAALSISTLAVTQFAYATNSPIITSLIVSDDDDLDEIYSIDDTITITFDSPTNEPGGTEPQMKSAVNDLFTFSESIGQAYNGRWTAPDIFTITIRNANTATLVIGSTIVTPTGITSILSADEMSEPSNSTSPVLTGDFGAARPDGWIPDEGKIYYDTGNVGIGTLLVQQLNLMSMGKLLQME